MARSNGRRNPIVSLLVLAVVGIGLRVVEVVTAVASNPRVNPVLVYTNVQRPTGGIDPFKVVTLYGPPIALAIAGVLLVIALLRRGAPQQVGQGWQQPQQGQQGWQQPQQGQQGWQQPQQGQQGWQQPDPQGWQPPAGPSQTDPGTPGRP